MKMKIAIAYTIAGGLLLLGWIQNSNQSEKMAAPPQVFQNAPFESQNVLKASGADAGGFARGPGFYISWNEGDTDVTPILQALKLRLSHLQKTELASDKNARILWDLSKHLNEGVGNVEIDK